MADGKLATWARIEPHAATTDINVGLAAEIADPLWLLGRQLQLGEFTGSDGGSPIDIELVASWAPLTRYRSGLPAEGHDAVDYDVDSMPLECLVESEAVRADTDWRAPAIWGLRLEQHFLNAPSVIADMRSAFPFSPPRGKLEQSGRIEARYLAVFAGATDGIAAFAALGQPAMAEIRARAPDPAAFTKALDEWAAEMREASGVPTASPAPSAWQANRLEYAFSIGSPGFGESQTLIAPEYDGTGFDWYHVDVLPGESLGAPGQASPDDRPRHFLPKPVSFPGMPADRFWEMEDGLVDLGAVDAGPTDLARMLATEYAVIYSPDWYVVPVEFPVGSLARVERITVVDTFGVTTLAGTKDSQAEDKSGRIFQLASTDDPLADIPYLFIPPAALYGQQSLPLEDLLIERDEQANLAWIIQKSVLGAAGRSIPLDPGTPPPISYGELPAGAEEPDMAYQVATWVPEGWIPLVQLTVDGEEAIPGINAPTILERGLLLETDDYKLRTASGILAVDIDKIFEEEVRRDGLRLQLVDQLARWIDGSTHLWRGRQKKAGRGESYAGLSFDFTGPKSNGE
ncbi:UNVERIFIED_ORG: hypothetical protein GGI66_006204 [Rhizobium esperanzae]